MREFKVGDIVAYDREYKITNPGCDGYWTVTDAYRGNVHLRQGGRPDRVSIGSRVSLISRPQTFMAGLPHESSRMIFPFEESEPEWYGPVSSRPPSREEYLSGRTGWVHTYKLGVSKGRTHGQSPCPVDSRVSEWMQPLRFQRRPVVHRASSGLRKQLPEYVPGSAGEAFNDIHKAIQRQIQKLMFDAYIPQRYWRQGRDSW